MTKFIDTDHGSISELAVRRIEAEQNRNGRHFNQIHYEIAGQAFTARAEASAVDDFLDLTAEQAFERTGNRQRNN